MSIYFTGIDIDSHVAFTDQGDILAIEDYLDDEDNPCLPEEAKVVNIRTGSNSFQRLEIVTEDA